MGTVTARRIVDLYKALERCEREIAAIERSEQTDSQAFLVTMGLEDWKRERTAIETELLKYGD